MKLKKVYITPHVETGWNSDYHIHHTKHKLKSQDLKLVTDILREIGREVKNHGEILEIKGK